MDNNSFFSRWSKRKLDPQPQANTESDTNEVLAQAPAASETLASEADNEAESSLAVQESGAADTESVEDSADEKEQSVATLLASQASQQVKKAALRKLFLSGEFSEVDRLNDYDHDYSKAKTLSSEVAQGLRDWLNKADESSADANGNLSTQSDEDSALHSLTDQTDSSPTSSVDERLAAQRPIAADKPPSNDDETQFPG